MSIGENIKKVRTSKDLTQKELGKKLGITAAAISALEKDKTNIKLSTVRKIAEALGVTMSDIVDDWSFFTLKEFKNDWAGLQDDDSATDCDKDSTIFDSLDTEVAKALDYDAAKARAFYEALEQDQKEDSGRRYALEKLEFTTIPLDYLSLNESGQKEAAKRVKELTYIPEYKKDLTD